MKLKKNQFGGRKVVGKAIMLGHWAQKVGEQLPPCLIGYADNDWLSTKPSNLQTKVKAKSTIITP